MTTPGFRLVLDAALRPDVVLMDVRMPGRDGIEATRDIVAPSRSTSAGSWPS